MKVITLNLEEFYNQLKDELLTEDEIGACLAAYEYSELSEDDILNFSTNNQITTNRYGVITIGPFKYYSFDDLVLAQDEASQLLQKELTPEKLKNVAIKTLQKFANDSWFDTVVEEQFEEHCNELMEEYDNIFSNKFIRACYKSGILYEGDFEQDEFGEPNFEKCTVSLDDMYEEYKDKWQDNRTSDSVEYFKDTYGTTAFRNEIMNNMEDAFEVSYYCDYLSKKEYMLPKILATYDGIQRVISSPDYTFYVYRVL